MSNVTVENILMAGHTFYTQSGRLFKIDINGQVVIPENELPNFCAYGFHLLAGSGNVPTQDPFVFVPGEAGTVVVSPVIGQTTSVIVDPAGTLAVMSLVLDDGNQEGQEIIVTFTEDITVLTFPGSNLAPSPELPGGIFAPQTISFAWSTGDSLWYRLS